MNNVDLQHVIDVNMSIGCQNVNWMSICQLDVNMSTGCQYVNWMSIFQLDVNLGSRKQW